MNLPEITAAISGAKAVYDIARGTVAITTDRAAKEKTNELVDKIQDLLSKLLEVQARMAELQHEKAQVDQKLAELDRWIKETAPNYRLTELAPGVFVYAYRPATETPAETREPPHYLCAGCFENRRKSLLQKKGYDHRGALLECHVCGVEIVNHLDKPRMEVHTVKKQTRWDDF